MTPDEIRRRKATSAMIEMLCQTSPAQAAFRDVGWRHHELTKELFAARPGDEDTSRISDELIACGERLLELAALVERQWGAMEELRFLEE